MRAVWPPKRPASLKKQDAVTGDPDVHLLAVGPVKR
jgi:hypothetical protein